MSSKRLKLRVGFVGCGRHGGARIYPSLELAGIDLVATCDLDRERAEQYARRFGAKSVYTDYRAMCEAEDLEAVLVVTGPQGHYEVGRELVAMGYPVWMEKPPAPTAGQAEELAAAAAEASVHVQVGFNYRYSAGVRRARSLIDGGQFAPPQVVSVRWWLGGAEDGDEFLQHYVVHAADLLAYLAGGLSRPHVRKAEANGRFYYVATFDGAGARGGAPCIAVLEASNHMHILGRWCCIEWQSETGMLRCSDFEEVTLTSGKSYEGRADMPMPSVGGSAPGPDVSAVTRWDPLNSLPTPATSQFERWGYAPELRLFAAIVRGEQTPECAVADAARAMRLGREILSIEG